MHGGEQGIVESLVDNQPISAADRLRLIYGMIAAPKDDGGVGVVPGMPGNTSVQSILPLHDRKFDLAWIKRWSRKWWIDDTELDTVRGHFGERVAFYYAFMQHYLLFLAIPSVIGVLASIFLKQYSVIFSVAVSFWTILYIESWRRQERRLSIRWEVKNCSMSETKWAEFQPKMTRNDPITGKLQPWMPRRQRLRRQALNIPFILFNATGLMLILTLIFVSEVFLTEIYNGPFKQYLLLTPTVLFSTLVPTFSTVYMSFAKRLTLFETYEHKTTFENAYMQKIFLLNIFTSYMSLFLAAYVYTPFANYIVPQIAALGLINTSYFDEDWLIKFTINPDRLRQQLIYFMITAQIISFGTDLIVPWALKYVTKKTGKLMKKNGTESPKFKDPEVEKLLLKDIRDQISRPTYDIFIDYAEMVVQFGYVSLFSSVWSLTPVCAFANNIIELRSDAIKLCTTMRRPIPERVDSIGPFLDFLSLLAWMGSITSSSLIFLFRNNHTPSLTDFIYYPLLLTIFLSEHAFFMVSKTVSLISKLMPVPGENENRAEMYRLRVTFADRYLKQAKSNVSDSETVNESSKPYEGLWSQKVDEVYSFASDIISEAKRISKTKKTD